MKRAFSSDILNSFSDINQMLFKLAKKDAESNGLTVPQLKALYKISSHPDIGLVELAESLKLTNSTVSGVVDRLVQQGLIERQVPPHDRRSVTIRLSATGEEKLLAIVADESMLVKKLRIIEQLPEEELGQLLLIHQHILDILTSEEQ
ncbi:DNA-binding MarR family transcriptional regulator [Sporosarcina luteola]|nr:DNA-binding MarR family transcriptional regulator [Sporosarcina luteola]